MEIRRGPCIAVAAVLCIAVGPAIPSVVDLLDGPVFARILVIGACLTPPLLLLLDQVLVKQRRIDVFSLWFFPPLYFLAYVGIGAFRSFAASSEANYACRAVLLGLGGWYLGLALAGERFGSLGHQLPYLSWDGVRLRRAVMLGFAVSVAGALVYFIRSGVPALSSDFDASRIASFQRAGGYVLYVFQSIRVPTILYFSFLLSTGRKRIGSYILAALMLLASVSTLTLSGARGQVGTMVIWLAIVYNYMAKRLRLRQLASLVLAGLAYYTAVGLLRTGQLSISLEPDSIWSYAVGAAGRNLYNLSRLLPRVPAFLPYQYGATFLQPFTLLLPGQQETVDMIVARTIGVSGVGGTPPLLVGELYLNFGWLGIPSGCFLLAFGLAKARARLLARNTSAALLLYSYLLLWLVGSFTSGLFLDLQPLWYLTVLLVLDRVSRRQAGQRAPASRRRDTVAGSLHYPVAGLR